jgi:hypothetical protein
MRGQKELYDTLINTLRKGMRNNPRRASKRAFKKIGDVISQVRIVSNLMSYK